MARLSFGFAFSHRASEGDHTAWIANLGTASDPFGHVDLGFEPPKLETLCPDYKLYPLPRLGSLSPIEGVPWNGVPMEAVSPAPRSAGIGFEPKRAFQFEPLVWAYDEAGRKRGALAWSVAHAGLPFPGAAWVCIGTEDETFWQRNKAPLVRLVRSAIKRKAPRDRFTPQKLAVVERKKVSKSDTVTVRDGHFWLNDKRWFAMGVNFWPRYAIGLEPEGDIGWPPNPTTLLSSKKTWSWRKRWA